MHRGHLVRHPGPSVGAGAEGNEDELLLALKGEAEGLSRRGIAATFWNPERVAAEYDADSWMKSHVSRRLRRARQIRNEYLAMATGR